MNNEEKAEIYHGLLLRHDKLDGKVADIKSEAAGKDLNKEQLLEVDNLEAQKAQVVAQAQQLFENY
jgi:hypothetical protein